MSQGGAPNSGMPTPNQPNSGMDPNSAAQSVSAMDPNSGVNSVNASQLDGSGMQT